MPSRRRPLRDALRQGVTQGATLAGQGGGQGCDGGGVVDERVGGAIWSAAAAEIIAKSATNPGLLLLPLRCC